MNIGLSMGQNALLGMVPMEKQEEPHHHLGEAGRDRPQKGKQNNGKEKEEALGRVSHNQTLVVKWSTQMVAPI